MITGRMCNNEKDCVRACVATLTDDDNVPHVFDEREPQKSWEALRSYLSSVGKKLIIFTLDDLTFMAEVNPDIPYMLIGSKKYTGESHAVVAMNDKVIFDPSWAARELIKHQEFDCWIIAIIL